MDKSPSSNLGSSKEEQGSEDLKQSTADMTQFTSFLNCNALDDMGNKIDELEQSINHLKAEMGVDGAVKATPEETKPSEGAD
ncbi:hypothetical protein J5N97_026597 [Dioscorea zingiberensis]|uniref:Heat shock factor-binding protein 1-like n=1 Tax=Dioscorea zingiberensis TaxID=325984 RepID=A0A9D5C3L5_9LILI|nr:hypothetical protein J5N97_001971 [Dioscorea zingiberensis]KAJ0965459.1 hypothetical protein J5N97_026597 [Dioscorea zingiberensis]